MGVMEKVIPAIYTGLYVLFLCLFMILAVLSAREELPTYARDPPLRRPVRRMALWLIRKLQERREKRRRKGKDLLIPGEEGVRNDLRTLYPSMKAGRKEVLYRMEKFERSLLLLFAAVVLAGAMHVRSFSSGILHPPLQMKRTGTEKTGKTQITGLIRSQFMPGSLHRKRQRTGHRRSCGSFPKACWAKMNPQTGSDPLWSCRRLCRSSRLRSAGRAAAMQSLIRTEVFSTLTIRRIRPRRWN